MTPQQLQDFLEDLDTDNGGLLLPDGTAHAGNVANTVATFIGQAWDCLWDEKEANRGGVARAAEHIDAARDVLAHVAAKLHRIDEADAAAALAARDA